MMEFANEILEQKIVKLEFVLIPEFQIRQLLYVFPIKLVGSQLVKVLQPLKVLMQEILEPILVVSDILEKMDIVKELSPQLTHRGFPGFALRLCL